MSYFRRITLFCCLFAVFSLGLGAQQQAGTAQPQPAAQPAAPAPAADAQDAEEPKDLPKQFREYVLGMSLDDLKAALEKDSIGMERLFNFRGDRDVSFLPEREESLVETTGSLFIRRAFFQLRDGNLFIMAYALNPRVVDHYSMFTDLVEKYGEPSSLSPKEAVWENDEVRLSLERPLTVKYIDKKVFEDIVNESMLIQSKRVQKRQDFLNDF